MSDSEERSSSFPRLYIAEWIAIAGILIIIISFVWEWGYWNAFGLSLAEIPISVEDLASSVLDWVPALLLVAALFTLVIFISKISFFSNMLDRLPNKEKTFALRNACQIAGNEKEASQWSQYHYMMMFNWWLMIAAPIALLLVQIIIGEVILISMLFIVFMLGNLLVPLIVNKINSDYEVIAMDVFKFFLLLAYIFIFGQSSAFTDVNDHSSRTTLTVMTSNGIQDKEMIVLKSNNNFVFAYDENVKKLIITPWRSIISTDFNSVPNFGKYDISFISSFIARDDESAK